MKYIVRGSKNQNVIKIKLTLKWNLKRMATIRPAPKGLDDLIPHGSKCRHHFKSCFKASLILLSTISELMESWIQCVDCKTLV